MRLVCIFCNVQKVKAQGLAKTSKFNLTLVFETELEGLLGNLLSIGNLRQASTGWSKDKVTDMIDDLQAGIILEGF